MKTGEILSGVKDRWSYYLIALFVLLLWTSVSLWILHQKHSVHIQPVVVQEICRGLLYLENTDNLKLTQEQAILLLPQVEKLSSAEANFKQIAEEIYSLLTPQQYLALVNLETPDSGTGQNFGKKVQNDTHGHKAHGTDAYAQKYEVIQQQVIQCLKAKIDEPAAGR